MCSPKSRKRFIIRTHNGCAVQVAQIQDSCRGDKSLLADEPAVSLTREPKLTEIWIGLHDHADSAPRWVDSRVSYTWLRSFEALTDIKAIAYLREHNYDNDVEDPIRNVYYRFRTKDIPNWEDSIASESPSLVFYNCCWYAAGAETVESLRCKIKNAIHVVRIHHQVTYLAAQPGFREFLLACDVAIAPTKKQMEDVRNLGFTGPIYSLPFGINAEPLLQAAQPFDSRDIQLASASNSHPARNLTLVEEVYEHLRTRGRRVENFVGIPPAQLAVKLGRTKIFWQTSMTEASGSRVLPEAIAAGCFPVVFEECLTTTELIREHRTGISLVSDIKYDYCEKTTSYPPDIVEFLVNELDRIIAEFDQNKDYEAPQLAAAYREHNEVAKLVEILRDASTQWRRPRWNWCRRMGLPVDPNGYAFNPTFFESAAGYVCIYRHVDSQGTRTLRRCLLDSNFETRTFSVWSDEIKDLGSKVEWYADPRAFQVGSNYYVSFNTGHSERPNQIYIVEIDENGAPLTPPIQLIKPDGRKEFEKNWGMFSFGGEIYAIYTISPFVILRIEFSDGVAIAHPVANHEWNSLEIESRFGELHGGASPVIIGDRGYYIAQCNSPSAVGRIYNGTILVFEAKPPFRPLGIAPAPAFTLSIGEMRATPEVRLNPPVTQCLYPCGAVHKADDKSLTICYGINDFRSGSRNYQIADLDACLIDISVSQNSVITEETYRTSAKFRKVLGRLRAFLSRNFGHVK